MIRANPLPVADLEISATRRAVVAAAWGFGISMLAEPSLALQAKGAKTPVPLPTPLQIRRDYQTMVDFGPRLPGHPNHVRFVDWMAEQFSASGLRLGQCEAYAYRRWDPLNHGLEILDGDVVKAVPKTAYFVRSHPTPPQGVTGPLVYGGKLSPARGAEAYDAAAVTDLPSGAIVVFDAQLPTVTLEQMLKPGYIHEPGLPEAEYRNRTYRRLWMMPPFSLDGLVARGAAGVVIIMDVSSDMISGNFSPHDVRYRPALPVLFAGQDVGTELRASAQAGKRARLTLNAEWVDSRVPSLTAVLPGESDEVMVIDTHTDGQNFVEENGCIAMVQLARHFASLPPGQMLQRSLVFAGWPGHMSGELPECPGWIRAHKDVVDRTAAAFTIEHLGASEWEDLPGRGYGPTGRNEYMNCPVTGGVLTDLLIRGFKKFDLKQHGTQRGSGVTTGAAFHETGVPHAGFISGPNYLLGIVPNGHMDKLDADLASRQTGMLAELIHKVDQIPAKVLREKDPTLGEQPVTGRDTATPAACIRGVYPFVPDGAL